MKERVKRTNSSLQKDHQLSKTNFSYFLNGFPTLSREKILNADKKPCFTVLQDSCKFIIDSVIVYSAANCMPGYYWDSTKCAKCAKGTYQPLSYQYNCTDCLTGLTTENLGATSATQCIGRYSFIIIRFLISCCESKESIINVRALFMRKVFKTN